MPLLRINASTKGLSLHGSAQPVSGALAQVAATQGPVVIMVHGYKYSPFIHKNCPHARIFALQGWPTPLGVHQSDVQGIAFGWHARGGLRQAYSTALDRARDLAQLISSFRGRRDVHLIAHSLGATLCLAALPYLRAGDVGRIVLLSGAAHLGLANHALNTPAGRSCEMFHVTSGENALFDHVFEQVVPDTGAIGRGLSCRHAMRIHIDCNRTLSKLSDLGYPLAPPQRRVCHWSSYTRPGVMLLNAALLNGTLPFCDLRSAIPPQPDLQNQPNPLVTSRKNRIMEWYTRGKGPHHEHAY
ncbi:alpha/beta hydrolase [Sulfitobacter sp.]|uniref:alpha/beta hydrolase n=1 Tax=Sulfitobacter sp. TaxID=1903071 RepID=UPI003001398D